MLAALVKGEQVLNKHSLKQEGLKYKGNIYCKALSTPIYK